MQENTSDKLRSECRQFAFETKCHGLNHYRNSRGSMKGLFWFSAMVCGIGVLASNLISLSIEFTHATKTTMSVRREQPAVFPAVTICNVSPVKRSALESLTSAKPRQRRAASCQSEYKGHCYFKPEDGRVIYSAAVEGCASLPNGPWYLVVIDSKEENQFAFDLSSPLTKNGMYIDPIHSFGVNDHDNAIWRDGQPDLDKDCLVVGDDGTWRTSHYAPQPETTDPTPEHTTVPLTTQTETSDPTPEHTTVPLTTQTETSDPTPEHTTVSLTTQTETTDPTPEHTTVPLTTQTETTDPTPEHTTVPLTTQTETTDPTLEHTTVPLTTQRITVNSTYASARLSDSFDERPHKVCCCDCSCRCHSMRQSTLNPANSPSGDAPTKISSTFSATSSVLESTSEASTHERETMNTAKTSTSDLKKVYQSLPLPSRQQVGFSLDDLVFDCKFSGASCSYKLVGIHVSNDLLSPGVVVETEQLTSWQHFRFTVSTKARLRVSTSIGDVTNEMFPNAVECRQQAKIEFQLKRGECNCPEACRKITYTRKMSYGLWPSNVHKESMREQDGLSAEKIRGFLKFEIYLENLDTVFVTESKAYTVNTQQEMR
ncbi:hypothetical protein CAPTEDRAFT_209572 [Capitella teleta]|uniref:C-type lectin domain-containing protein n=1 Tax=Capitella teleta TaxID=283909 RepID=R7VMB7_CAPTE|nr:hypothetical protein CAPTEDRAFT_209572 [Capitella teleta]|eukprot:ELU18560.1 hypothetical protein CAPTEDRAFT_209572 [Capitella teleta]